MNVKIIHLIYTKKDGTKGFRFDFTIKGLGVCGENDSVEIEASEGEVPFGGQDFSGRVLAILTDPENNGKGIFDIMDQIKMIIAKGYHLPLYREMAEKESYKPGWVFYAIKDRFGYEIASKICEK